jgi:hypothetical protein
LALDQYDPATVNSPPQPLLKPFLPEKIHKIHKTRLGKFVIVFNLLMRTPSALRHLAAALYPSCFRFQVLAVSVVRPLFEMTMCMFFKMFEYIARFEGSFAAGTLEM